MHVHACLFVMQPWFSAHAQSLSCCYGNQCCRLSEMASVELQEASWNTRTVGVSRSVHVRVSEAAEREVQALLDVPSELHCQYL